MKKVLSLLLVLCFIFLALVSCNGDEQPSETVSETVGETKDTSVTLEETDDWGQNMFISAVPIDELDFEGESITVIVRNSKSYSREWTKESPEDELDSAIATRNEQVASDLNLQINYAFMGTSNYSDCERDFSAAISQDIGIGIHEYDISANYAYVGALPSFRDFWANMADSDVFPYFNFKLPCWNQSIVENTLINGQLYYIAGDLNLTMFDRAMVIYFNKDLYDKKKNADDPENLQDLALAGDWTYTDLYRWATLAPEDDNGTAGIQCTDFHAISAPFGSCPLDSLPYAWDLELVKVNNDKTLSYNILGNQKLEDAIVFARDLFKNEGVENSDRWGACGLGGAEQYAHFAAGTCIFAVHLLYHSDIDNLNIRSMEDSFGLLPMPKYDTAQENYGTTAQDAYTLVTVLNHWESDIPTKGTAVSAYLQYANELSYYNVRSYYIERVIKGKSFGTNDDDGTVTKSIRVFEELIADHVEFDFLTIYAPQLNAVVNNCWRNSVMNGSTAEDNFTAQDDKYYQDLEVTMAFLGLTTE